MDQELRALIDDQAGMVARRQLNAHDVDADRVTSATDMGVR